MKRFRRIATRARHGRLLIPLALCQMLAVSCATKPPQPATAPTHLHYTAVSAVKRTAIPTTVYLFPPLLCDAKGKPKESLSPVEDPALGITDWVAPSAKSKTLRRQLENQFRSRGNRVVTFQDVLTSDDPHSILIVSSFYSVPQTVASPKPGQADRSILTMVKTKTFGVDLDPANSRNIANIDGITFYDSTRNPADIEARSLEAGLSWLGENVSGVTPLDR